MSSTVVSRLSTLIAEFEGYGTAAAPSITAGNNPGAIMAGPYADSQGAVDVAPNGTAVFPDLATGQNALETLVQHLLSSGYNTPETFINQYEGVQNGVQAPGNTAASTSAYQSYVAQGLGIGPQDPITGAPAASASAAPAPASGGSSWNPFAGAAGAVGASFERVVVGLLGVILIALGVFFLRPVQDVVTNIAGAAKDVVSG
jgi:hypothetical protein